MAEVAVLLLWDVWLVRTGRDAVSTRIRRMWRRRPLMVSLLCAGLVWHLTRPDMYARYDLLSLAGDRVRRR